MLSLVSPLLLTFGAGLITPTLRTVIGDHTRAVKLLVTHARVRPNTPRPARNEVVDLWEKMRVRQGTRGPGAPGPPVFLVSVLSFPPAPLGGCGPTLNENSISFRPATDTIADTLNDDDKTPPRGRPYVFPTYLEAARSSSR